MGWFCCKELPLGNVLRYTVFLSHADDRQFILNQYFYCTEPNISTRLHCVCTLVNAKFAKFVCTVVYMYNATPSYTLRWPGCAFVFDLTPLLKKPVLFLPMFHHGEYNRCIIHTERNLENPCFFCYRL